MDGLDFRKKLTEYGITKEEYETMTPEEQTKIDNRIKKEMKADNIKKVGKGVQSAGCLIMLIPILIIFVVGIVMILF